MEIKVIFQSLDCVTSSDRFYPKAVFKKAIRKFKKELVVNDKAMGECYLKQFDDKGIDPEINLSNVSHIVTEIKTKGDKAVGKIKILDTPRGKKLKEWLEYGIEYVVALRGLGMIEKNDDGISV